MMRERERRHEEDGPGGGQPGQGNTGGNLGGLRQAGEGFLAAADAAIGRALSGDSEQFLAMTRQQGGE